MKQMLGCYYAGGNSCGCATTWMMQQLRSWQLARMAMLVLTWQPFVRKLLFPRCVGKCLASPPAFLWCVPCK